ASGCICVVKQKTAYEIETCLEFRRVLFRSWTSCWPSGPRWSATASSAPTAARTRSTSTPSVAPTHWSSGRDWPPTTPAPAAASTCCAATAPTRSATPAPASTAASSTPVRSRRSPTRTASVRTWCSPRTAVRPTVSPRASAPQLPGARAAPARAPATGATVPLKGAVTLIAPGDCGPLRAQDDATPQLATAGTGDVLAGVLGTLLAAGLSGPGAATVAAILHGRAGRLASHGGRPPPGRRHGHGP